MDKEWRMNKHDRLLQIYKLLIWIKTHSLWLQIYTNMHIQTHTHTHIYTQTQTHTQSTKYTTHFSKKSALWHKSFHAFHTSTGNSTSWIWYEIKQEVTMTGITRRITYAEIVTLLLPSQVGGVIVLVTFFASDHFFYPTLCGVKIFLPRLCILESPINGMNIYICSNSHWKVHG